MARIKLPPKKKSTGGQMQNGAAKRAKKAAIKRGKAKRRAPIKHKGRTAVA